ncbi:MAG TPA: hypothetical protein VHO25_11985, partial [Polyangiaceae bacterium]|nr:hypothetical protein [Polyangiaceae bacterium]
MAFERGSRSLLTVFALSCALAESACSSEQPPSRPPAAPASPASPPAGQVTGNAAAHGSWWNTVQHSLIAGEHRFRAATTGFEAGNRTHNLRAHFTNQGIRFASRTASNVPGPRVRFSSIGREDHLQSVSPVAPTLGECDTTGRTDERGECLKRLEYRYADSVVEWWENHAGGFEQGWLISHKPSGRGALELTVKVDNAQLKVSE